MSKTIERTLFEGASSIDAPDEREAFLDQTCHIPIICPERTVADCFKYRNQVGLDTCVEALREVIRSRRGNVSEIQCYAQLNRVDRVMRPFLEDME